MSDIKIVVGADVGQALTGLRAVQGELGKTAVMGKTTTTAIGGLKNAFTGIGSTLASGGVLAGIGIALAGASKWLQIVAKDFITTGKSADDSAKKIKEYTDNVNGAIKAVGREATEVLGLVGILKSETETRDRKLSAIKELQKIQPEIFAGLKLEKDAVIGLDDAYRAYLVNLQLVIEAKILQATLEDKITRQLKLQKALTESFAKTNLKDALFKDLKPDEIAEVSRELNKLADNTKLFGLGITRIQASGELEQLTDDIDQLGKRLFALTQKIKVPKIKIKPDKIEIEEPDEINTEHFSKFLGLDNKLTAGELIIKPKVLVQPDIKFLPIGDQVINGMLEYFSRERLRAFQEEASSRIRETFINIIEVAISSVTDSVATALIDGGSFLPNLFGGLMRGIGQQIKELGKYLVGVGVKMLAAKKAIQLLKFTPQTAIIAGIGLQLLGSLLTAAAQKQFNSSRFASGVRNFQGGFATVGERGPERVFLPRGSSVQPNNEMMAYSGSAGSYIAETRISGTDLVILLRRGEQQMSRNN